MPSASLSASSSARAASYTVTLPGGAGFCNAVRRSLIEDVESWAPRRVTFRTNTSCQTDEFLSHRIGLVPFRRAVEQGATTLDLRVAGPTTVRAADLVGSGMEAVYPDIEIMVLAGGQELDLTVEFDKRAGSAHTRYAPCGAVGMRRVDGDGRHQITFEIAPGESAKQLYNEALDALEARVDAALHALAHQPETPPASMC